MKRILPVTFLIALAALAWLLVYVMVVVRDVGSVSGFWAPERLIAYVAFIAAPAATFIPIARTLRIPLYDLEAIAAWSTLGFVVTFFDPGDAPSMGVMLVALIPLLMSLATIFTLVSYAVGFRLLTRRSQRYDFVRARREGYLISMFVVGCLLLSALDVLTLTNAALLALIVFLIEVFLLSRSPAAADAPHPPAPPMTG